MNVLVRNATVVTNDFRRLVHAPGAVFVEGAVIKDVGPSAVLEARYPNPDRTIDATNMVVIPGMINLHVHAGWTVYRGQVEDADPKRVFRQTYFPMSKLLRSEERRDIGAYTYLELLRSGVTTVVEVEEDAEAFAPFVEKLGIRSAMGVMVVDIDSDSQLDGSYRVDPDLHRQQTQRAIDFARDWHGAADGRITTVLAPRGVLNSSPAQLDALRTAADRLGRPIAIHLGWSSSENEVTGKLYGAGAFEHAEAHGMLGPDVIATHCFVVDDADIDRLVRTRTHIGHCPVVNALRGHVAPIARYREAGLTVGLGTDNYFGDFFEVLRGAATVARVRAGNGTAVSSQDAFEMATLDAARALGMEHEIGSIEVGKRADIAIVDARKPGLAPLGNPVSSLVWHANMSHVDSVLVAGRLLLDRGRVTTVDEDRVIESAHLAHRAAWARLQASAE